jgi:hypothetical protein
MRSSHPISREADILRRYPDVPRSRLLADVRAGRLRADRTNQRLAFHECDILRWEAEWLAMVMILDRHDPELLIIHGRDSAILLLLEIEGTRGYPRTPRPMHWRRQRIDYLRSLGIVVDSVAIGSPHEKHVLRSAVSWVLPGDRERLRLVRDNTR